MSPFKPVATLSLDEITKLLTDSILVIPTVSAGNVPQLTTDLLVYSLGLQLVGRLSDEFVYPFAGPRDAPAGVKTSGISTAVEVFSGNGITFIQVRSPTLPGFRRKFVTATLIPFINQFKFAETIAIASSNAALRESVNSPRFILMHPPQTSLSDRLAKISLDAPMAEAPPSLDYLPESGIVLDLLEEITSLPIGQVCAPVLFVYEGDNFGDAHEFADQVASVLGIDSNAIKASLPTPGEWTQPVSWQRVYGKSIPVGLEEGLYS